MARGLVALLAAALGSSPVVCLGQTGSPELTLTLAAPPGCPAPSAVRAEVLALAASPLGGARHLYAWVVIEPDDAGFTLRMTTELDGVRGERTLTGASCPTVVDAAVLTLALTLNPALEAPAAAPRAPPPSAAARPVATSRGSEPRVRPRWRGAAGFATGVNAGILPDPAPELGVGVEAGRGTVSVTVLAAASPLQHELLEPSPPLGGRLWAAELSVLGCWLPGSPVIQVGPCLGIETDVIHGEGMGTATDPPPGTIYFTGPAVALQAQRRLGKRWILGLSVGSFVPVERPAITLSSEGGEEVVHRPSWVGGRVRLALSWSSP